MIGKPDRIKAQRLGPLGVFANCLRLRQAEFPTAEMIPIFTPFILVISSPCPTMTALKDYQHASVIRSGPIAPIAVCWRDSSLPSG
jgi:hypothetical protein